MTGTGVFVLRDAATLVAMQAASFASDMNVAVRSPRRLRDQAGVLGSL